MPTITQARILTEDAVIENGWLAYADGIITGYGPGQPPQANTGDAVIDAAGATLVPGFIDLHCHGGNGDEVMDADPATLRAIADFKAQHGVTGWLATTWTAPHDSIMAALHTIRAAIDDIPNLLGAHIEGPYINREKIGAQSPDAVRTADRAEAEAILDTGLVRLMALAPEIEANQWLIGACVAQGIAVSAAHTNATFDDIVAAVERGVTQLTHTYNAMRGLHHREPGVVGAGLLLDDLRCEVICDGIHVHPMAVRILYEHKGPHHMILITDAVRAAGLPDGSFYKQDGRPITVTDGRATLTDGTLAGSTLTMDAALRNIIEFTGVSLAEVWPCFSLTPARAIGLDERKGSIAVGKDADLVLLNDQLQAIHTIIAGKTVAQPGK